MICHITSQTPPTYLTFFLVSKQYQTSITLPRSVSHFCLPLFLSFFFTPSFLLIDLLFSLFTSFHLHLSLLWVLQDWKMGLEMMATPSQTHISFMLQLYWCLVVGGDFGPVDLSRHMQRIMTNKIPWAFKFSFFILFYS